MKSTENICKHCHKPLSDCREADKQLIKPLNPAHIHLNNNYVNYKLDRIEKAVNYILGCYDISTNRFYMYNRNTISDRLLEDTVLSLSKCILEEDDQAIYFPETRLFVMEDNVQVLPLENEYITILIKLSADVIVTNSNL